MTPTAKKRHPVASAVTASRVEKRTQSARPAMTATPIEGPQTRTMKRLSEWNCPGTKEPKLSAKAADTLTSEVAQKDAMPRRDFARKDYFSWKAMPERPAKYLAPPDLPPLSAPSAYYRDFRGTIIGILSLSTFIAGIALGKVL